MRDLSFWGCIVLLITVLLISAAGAFIIMLLWNWLAPLFWANAPILGFWETWGILFLINLIVNMFRKK